jgi:hypothetical protein
MQCCWNRHWRLSASDPVSEVQAHVKKPIQDQVPSLPGGGVYLSMSPDLVTFSCFHVGKLHAVKYSSSDSVAVEYDVK